MSWQEQRCSKEKYLCPPPFGSQTVDTVSPKELGFPQGFHTGRKKRLKPGAIQRGTCLLARVFTPF